MRLSKYLNTRFQLPVNTQQIMCSWEIILQRCYNNTTITTTNTSTSGWNDYFIKYQQLYNVIVQAFRFNLRGFASYRVIACTGIVSFLCFYYIGILSMLNLTFAMTFFCLIAFYNGNFFM